MTQETRGWRQMPDLLPTDDASLREQVARHFRERDSATASAAVRWRALPHYPVRHRETHEPIPPAYATPGAAAFDLHSADDVIVPPRGRVLIRTGLAVEFPRGLALLILPRSGLALRHGLTVANAPGLVDSDYRGEIGIIVLNNGAEDYLVSRGERIAQAMLVPAIHAFFQHVDSLGETERGAGGFGSTGL